LRCRGLLHLLQGCPQPARPLSVAEQREHCCRRRIKWSGDIPHKVILDCHLVRPLLLLPPQSAPLPRGPPPAHRASLSLGFSYWRSNPFPIPIQSHYSPHILTRLILTFVSSLYWRLISPLELSLHPSRRHAPSLISLTSHEGT